MKRLDSTIEHLTEIDNRINSGFFLIVSGYHAERYTEIQQDEQGFFIAIDENDLRNPLQFLTSEELDMLVDYVPPIQIEVE